MRVFGISALLVGLLLSGNYWYGVIGLTCKLPVYYSIGEFDERFGLSRTETEAALLAAEEVWEKSLGRDDIFTYKADSSLKVNFIYDERQREAEAADRAKADLNTRGEANAVLVELHRQLVSEYETYEKEYDVRRARYETNLASYNAEVEKYNQEGGAPPAAYESLENQRSQLDDDRVAINGLAEKLNDLADRINEIGEKGNELIGEYNDRVNQFNDTYVRDEEYTQGDYRARQINVYTFNDKRELVLVLAHELGHALAIDHVQNTASIMYYLMGGQGNPPALTEEDKKAFVTACEPGFLSRLLAAPRALYNSVVNN